MISTALLVAALSAAAPDVTAAALVRDRFEAKGRAAPELDPALSKAATEIAAHALRQSAKDAAALLPLTRAVSGAGGWDPQPTTLVVKNAPDQVLGMLGRRPELASDPATHAGVGWAENGDEAALVVLLTRRRLELRPFARTFKAPPKSQRLCATLLPPLASAELFVTRPGGATERGPLTRAGDEWCAMVELPSPGRHTVEVLALGPQGPQVGALFFVTVGPDTAKEDEKAEREPATVEEARAAILARTNALRLSQGRAAVVADPPLQAVAQAYADRMAAEGFFAHVAPDGSDVRQRLVSAGYRYTLAGENLGSASGPLAAHFSVEHSPAHRKNLLEPEHRRLGVGIASADDGQTLLVELLTSPADDGGADPLGAAYAALHQARALRKLPRLARSPVLEALAQAHARAAFERDTPKVELPGVPKLHDRAFEVLDDAKSVAVDVFIATSPSLVTESKNLESAGNSQVGVGLVRGDSAKYGKDRFWVFVVYAATREGR